MVVGSSIEGVEAMSTAHANRGPGVDAAAGDEVGAA
jgi:hypothetical protein